MNDPMHMLGGYLVKCTLTLNPRLFIYLFINFNNIFVIISYYHYNTISCWMKHMSDPRRISRIYLGEYTLMINPHLY